jgi:Carboxypeptidase regulatory-like domain
MSDKSWPTVVMTVVLLTLGVSAQVLAQPPRDPRANIPVMPTGKGSITGTVIVAGTGQPARRARVNLNGSAEAAGSVSTMTDDQGRFTFNSLPEGRFSLSASKPGHISGSYGQRRPGRAGTPIQLAAGQRLQVQIQLWRGGVLTGTLVDEHGEAIPGTPVRALRFVMQNGERTLQPAGNGQTDDRGVYRIYGLQPGDYLVNATPRNPSGPDEDRMLAEVRALTERMQAMPAATADDARAAMTRLSMLQSIDASDDGSTGYAPVYYPGTTAPASAQTISLGPGEEKGGIDFQYQIVPIARIEGIVTGVQSPQGLQVTIINTGFEVPGASPGNARVDQQGTFRISNVPPGQYRLIARANIAPADGGPNGRGGGPGRGGMGPGFARMGGPGSPLTRLWATADVAVDGRNVTNVVLTLQPGMSFAGRVAFEGSLSLPSDLSRVRVTLSPIPPVTTGNVSMAAAASVDSDGRFTIGSVTPGRYRVSANAPGGWYLGSVAIEGQDAFDFPIDIKPNQSVSGAVVTFTDKQTELTGTVVNERAQPVVDYSLIIYPADKRYITAFSRRIQTTRPATDGRFSFRNLPPGDYRLAPVLDLEPGSSLDPAFLEQLDSSATRISLSDGEKKDQTLRVPTGG